MGQHLLRSACLWAPGPPIPGGMWLLMLLAHFSPQPHTSNPPSPSPVLLGAEILAFPWLGWHLDPKRSEPFASLVRCLGAGSPHRGGACCGPCCPVPRGDPAILPHLLPTSGGGLYLLPGPPLSLQEGLTSGWKDQADHQDREEAELPPPCRGCRGAREWT